MISKIIESFLAEMNKENNQQAIQTAIGPYLSSFSIGFYLFIFVIVLLVTMTSYNSYTLYSIQKLGKFSL